MAKKQGRMWRLMVKNQGIKRIVIDVPIELHKKIKLRSKLRYITMRIWMLRAIFERIRQEELYDKPK